MRKSMSSSRVGGYQPGGIRSAGSKMSDSGRTEIVTLASGPHDVCDYVQVRVGINRLLARYYEL